ncbi:PAS domain S-box protein [Almyronema epifaneia]|uniref:PAS domain S-box protein n=1 Tax=Almyronema epifaneia S1 TaxID=2991925 RepID=A0ABW6IFF5_9CYAN
MLAGQSFSAQLPKVVVGIGFAASGFESLAAFFSAIPNPNGVAFVLVSHLLPEQERQLLEQLQQQTEMPLQLLSAPLELRANTIFLVPAGLGLRYSNQTLTLSDCPLDAAATAQPINATLTALAEAYRDRAIGLVLAGTGEDGGQGLAAIAHYGGSALVESPPMADVADLPREAIATGVTTQAGPPAYLASVVYAIAQELSAVAAAAIAATASDAVVLDQDYSYQVIQILNDYGDIDFSLYKPTTFKRRLQRHLSISGWSDQQAYLQELRHTAEERERLRKALLIGTTNFFRDPEVWQVLKQQVIPELIEQAVPYQELRLWVPACSTGEEAYSLAILMTEAIRAAPKRLALKVFATDIDSDAIRVASAGIYPEAIAQHVTAEYLRSYFSRENGYFRVNALLRDAMVFAPHNLAKNAPFSRIDLVSCRNILIYLQPHLQNQVLRTLHFALNPRGFLTLGAAESLGDLDDEFEIINSTWKIFRKRRDVHLSLTPPSRTAYSLMPIHPHTTRLYSHSETLSDLILEATYASRQAVCLVTNRNHQLLHVVGDASQILLPPRGRFSTDLLSMLHTDLRLPISTAIYRIRQDQNTVTYTDISVNQLDATLFYNLRAEYHRNDSLSEEIILLVLQLVDTRQPQAISSTPETFEPENMAQQRILELERNLQEAQENLQVTVENLEASNEEQQATNEELLASNEELQSTNEELRSVNEELRRLNTAYQAKIQELTELNQDVDNLLRSTDIGVIFLDQHLLIRKFTPPVTQIIQLSPHDINRSITNFRHSTTCRNFLGLLQQVIDTEVPLEQEIALHNSSDEYLMRLHPYYRLDGQCDGLVVTFVKINTLRQAQRKIEQQKAELEYLYRTLPAGLSLIDQDLVFVRINEQLAAINGLSVQETLGKTIRQVLPELADQLEPLYRQVFATGEPIERIEIRGTTPANPTQQRDWLVGYNLVQMPNNRRMVGSVVRDITDLKTAQRQLEELARSLEQRVRDRTFELEQSQLALQARERQLSTLLNNSPDIICRFDLNGRLIFANAALAKFKQVPATDLSRYTISEDLSAAFANLWQTAMQQTVATGESQVLEYERIFGDQVYWFEAQFIPEYNDQGTIVSILEVSRDITDRKQTEQDLQSSENKLRLFVEHSPAAIAMFDKQMRYLAVSRCWLEDYRLGDRDLIGQSHYEVFPEIPPTWRAVHQRALAGAIESSDADPFMRMDGSVDWVRWQVRPWFDKNNTIGGIIMFTEVINEQVIAQQALARSETRFRQLAENIQEVFFLTSLDSREMLYVSPAYETIWGQSCDRLYAEPTAWIDSIHPSDRDRVVAAFARQKRELTPFEEDYRIVRADNSIRWIRARAFIVTDETGNAVRIAGIAEDITEIRNLQNYHRFVQRVADASPNLLYIYNIQQNTFIYTNQAMTDLLGFDPRNEPLPGSNLVERIVHPDDRNKVLAYLETVYNAADNAVIELELRLCDSQGQWHWMLSRNSVFLRNEQGQTEQIIGTAQDITESKQARQQLQEALLSQEVLLREVHHRVKNNLNVIHSLLNMQVRAIDNEQLRSVLTDSQQRIQSMALIHEQLYQSRNFVEVEFAEYLNQLVHNLLVSANINPTRIQILLNVDAVPLDLQTAIPLGLIVNELITNAFKHAFPGDRSGAVEVTLAQSADQTLLLSVADNGIGLPSNFSQTQSASLGMRLVNILVRQLRAELEVQSNQGACFMIRLPKVPL